MSNIKVNVPKLRNNIDRFNSLLNTFYDINLNYYNEVKNSMLWANDTKLDFLYNDIFNNEKIKKMECYNQMIEIKNIFNYTCEEYEKFGKVIEFDLTQKSRILNKFNQCINKLTRINSDINSLTINADTAALISDVGPQIRRLLEDLNNLKNLTIDTMSNIKEIERQVKYKLNNTKITMIREKDYMEFI